MYRIVRIVVATVKLNQERIDQLVSTLFVQIGRHRLKSYFLKPFFSWQFATGLSKAKQYGRIVLNEEYT